jgi:hypothetical protein
MIFLMIASPVFPERRVLVVRANAEFTGKRRLPKREDARSGMLSPGASLSLAMESAVDAVGGSGTPQQ